MQMNVEARDTTHLTPTESPTLAVAAAPSSIVLSQYEWYSEFALHSLIHRWIADVKMKKRGISWRPFCKKCKKDFWTTKAIFLSHENCESND